MAKFGQTWWGSQWLNSLSNIDYSNRLPRGRAYAGNNSVRDISITKNIINAKVKGSRPKPYNIEISIPKFSPEQKKELIDEIINNTHILAKLINSELPEELFEIAKKKGIKIFPSTWKDFNMKCSCPDWAVPCKHIAAVIYIVANEIDKNPFLVFQLHDLDVLAEIKKAGVVPKNSQIAIAQTSDFLIQKIESVEKIEIQNEHEILSNIDFSKIPALKEEIFSLLDDATIFTSKSFKPILYKAYTTLSKNVTKIFTTRDESEEIDFVSEYEKYNKLVIFLNGNLKFNEAVLFAETDEQNSAEKKVISNLVKYLDEIPVKYTDRLSKHLNAVYGIFHFAAKLMQQCAFIPQLLQLANGKYFIRYIPALIDEEIKNIYNKLQQITPPDLLQVVPKKNSKPLFISANEQVKLLTSLFIDYYIEKFLYSLVNSDDIIIDMFLGGETYSFDKLDEKGTPQAIDKWLSKFYIAQKDFSPLLRIDEENDNSFLVSLLIENKKESLSAPIPLNEFLTKKKYFDNKFPVLESLSNLSSHYTDLKTIIASSGKQKLTYNSVKFPDVLLKIIPTLKLLGINILLPNSLKSLVRPQISLSLKDKNADTKGISYLSLNEMLAFQWQIALGDINISVEEFRKLVKGLSGIVKIKNRYILINQDEIQKLLNNLQNDIHLDSHELLQIALSEEYHSAKIEISPTARKIIRELVESKTIEIPEEIKAQLRPYQQRGFEWLYKNVKVGFGSIIADDMGLGKTLQVIAMIQKLKSEKYLEKNPGLVIVPTALLTNWTKEIQKFAPDLHAAVYHGTKRELIENEIDIIITTYGIIRSDSENLSKKKWAFIVIDEAQNIKNPTTGQTKAIKKIKSPIKIAMSGTPVENRLSEYWSIFDFTNKNYLGSLKYFKTEFANPIEIDRNIEKLEKFKTITKPFIIRRLKTDKNVISDLPDKVENNQYVNLTKEQTGIYQNVVNNIMAEITSTEDENTIKRKGLIFKLMTALKQICNHPSQFLKKEDFNPELSGKALMLLNLLEKIYDNNEKVLIFTQYKEMGDLLEKIIQTTFHTSPLFLHGGISRQKRDKMVEDFQTQKHLKTFILSIKAGGTGLNLTAANNVIHYDLWWNPAVENQATDRAFRIGQQKNVMVYRLITQGTFEEKINEMLVSKKELADLTITSGEKWIGELTNAELNELVKI